MGKKRPSRRASHNAPTDVSARNTVVLDIVHDASDDGSVEVETVDLKIGPFGATTEDGDDTGSVGGRDDTGSVGGRAATATADAAAAAATARVGRTSARRPARRSSGGRKSNRGPTRARARGLGSPRESAPSASAARVSSASPTSPIARRIHQVKSAFTSLTKGTSPSVCDGDAGDDSNRNRRRHSEDEVRSQGLKFVGFDERRQASVNKRTNDCRFKAFYGVPPITVAAILDDLVEGHPELKYDYFFMTLNWLYLYETYPVLSGRWQYSENHIGRAVISYGKMLQQLSRKIISFEFKDGDGPYLFSLDTVNFLCYEMRLDPSAKWFDPKSKSAGLFCLSLSEPRIVWIRGPVPASTADITMFRGGTTDVSKDQWDKSALYHQVPKVFNILGTRFRHGTSVEERMSLHQMAVEADHAKHDLVCVNLASGYCPLPSRPQRKGGLRGALTTPTDPDRLHQKPFVNLSNKTLPTRGMDRKLKFDVDSASTWKSSQSLYDERPRPTRCTTTALPPSTELSGSSAG
ncbi:hypothetical protein THAOC_32051 [Thalassiosira oceanica]|uniref:Uncharacterized protein n=1 Tax=Thalassiosira oceanica TaxID=159749 RepID=K0RA41_THAOC|nr:hypothetical protein THAOC_32051 [Thalassiosira oceanica]|eukprot:EJK49104.1 hypothetical protein THAOC_32051 [Thalassiosira oceanica]